MDERIDFQTIIMNLQRFWAGQGCLIWQPYYTQVGAGTYNPATFLRVLGPEPWHVGYVEPSVRPDDGRYGENPNRLQQHTQFQVILKPDPGNPQEIYLQSLQALGIDPSHHDIRFVEDNWESPALGAWGLGWEVWLDGQEITQFTYFQQAGGIVLEPVSVEITYGLERIAMALQHVRNFRDIRWSPQRTYGDVNLQGEQEHSKYYFETAEVERVRNMYDLFEKEAEAALDQGLVLPAHDYVLKCSHTFNILDTRGAIGVTERAAFFARMRDLARKTAEAYLLKREELGFPWLAEFKTNATQPAAAVVEGESKSLPPGQTGDFLLEIGTEELPAGDLTTAMEQLEQRIPPLLDELRLAHGVLRVLGTPRRLVVVVSDLAASQAERESLVKGPPVSRALDEHGKPTKAAEGFARSRGLAVNELQTAEIDGGSYLVARVREKGRSALETLGEALPGLINALRFDKTMRWNASGAAFSRPIRWLAAVYSGQVVPFSYAGLQSGRATHGLRFQTPASFTITTVLAYLEFLKSQGILIDPAERKSAIQFQVGSIIQASGGDPMRLDESLLDEVTNLVEAPTALRGSFEETHLSLPQEVLVSVMQKHQRYFPVFRADGKLLPYFVAVRNGDGQHQDVVADGNEQVIRARFADAAFFITEDLKHKLEDFLPRLSTLTFQVKLGSMLDKTRRIEKLVDYLILILGLDQNEAADARRASALYKADLVSNMVVEMTTLQGLMGQYYAIHSGEPERVAQAIFEAYLPRFSGDAAPASAAGLVVGIADRLDTLAGLFAAGLAPSGSKDPFAQRRAALGLVQNLIAWKLSFNLQAALQAAADNLPFEASAQSQLACLEFIAGRLQNLLLEQGYRYDVVSAVLTEQSANPYSASQAVEQLSRWVSHPDWHTILPAYARCVRITRDQPQQYSIQPESLIEPAERALLGALLQAETTSRQAGSVDGMLEVFLPMIPVINQFFDKILVMDEDLAKRANRLGLLQRISALAKGVADFSKLEGF